MIATLEAPTLAPQFTNWHPSVSDLRDPFVVMPADPDTIADMQLVEQGLRMLDASPDVSPDAIGEAFAATGQARNAAMTLVKGRVLESLPDPDHDEYKPLGWAHISWEFIRDWRARLGGELAGVSSMIFVVGPGAHAARLGLRALAEQGDPDCDSVRLAMTAGAVAIKCSSPVLNGSQAEQLFRATTRELGVAQARGDREAVQSYRHSLRWILDHTVFRQSPRHVLQ